VADPSRSRIPLFQDCSGSQAGRPLSAFVPPNGCGFAPLRHAPLPTGFYCAGPRHRPGVYDAHLFGPPERRIQIILLDTRYFRSSLVGRPKKNGDGVRPPYQPNEDESATLLGEAQWQWLQEQLKVPAKLRIVATSIQFVSDRHDWEKWNNFPHERQRLIDLIAKTKAGGCVFVSGDRHMAELSMLKPGVDGAPYPLYDLTSSGRRAQPPPGLPADPADDLRADRRRFRRGRADRHLHRPGFRRPDRDRTHRPAGGPATTRLSGNPPKGQSLPTFRSRYTPRTRRAFASNDRILMAHRLGSGYSGRVGKPTRAER